ncbi:M4 family metallopeptidase, partial [Streptomyces rubiginosohelvolus]
MVLVGMQTGTANAHPNTPGDSASATPAFNSASARTAAIESAQSDASATASALKLGAKEKLIARDVIKDADGTVHT